MAADYVDLFNPRTGLPWDDFDTIDAMRIYGGGFVKALAEAAFHADPQNLARLKAAFPDYWATYREMAAYWHGR